MKAFYNELAKEYEMQGGYVVHVGVVLLEAYSQNESLRFCA